MSYKTISYGILTAVLVVTLAYLWGQNAQVNELAQQLQLLSQKYDAQIKRTVSNPQVTYKISAHDTTTSTMPHSSNSEKDLSEIAILNTPQPQGSNTTAREPTQSEEVNTAEKESAVFHEMTKDGYLYQSAWEKKQHEIAQMSVQDNKVFWQKMNEAIANGELEIFDQ